MTAPTCGTCRWLWLPPLTNDPTARVMPVCKRYPRTELKRHDDWCGEHAPKGEQYDGPCPTCQRGYK